MARDDFSGKTKDLAAKRVGYRCSFPGCGAITIGASMEGNDKVSSIGEAAHICAASPGGKRYDNNMTSDERKNIDNCIWMCRKHARLIDTDEETYTVEKLKDWKKQAEKDAADALAGVESLKEYYDSYEKSLDIIAEIYDNLIAEGSFHILSMHLKQYTASLSESYDEFVLRYKVIYDIYCDRFHLEQDLVQYISTNRAGVDRIVEELSAFMLVDYLRKIVGFCENSELVRLAQIIINDQVVSTFFMKPENGELFTVSTAYLVLIHKIITNQLYISEWFGLKYHNGEEFRLYDQEFYYKIQAAIHEIQYRILYLNSERSDEVDKLFHYIVQNLEKWNQFDISIITIIWKMILFYVLDDHILFQDLYDKCPYEVKQTPEIYDLYCWYLKKYEPEKLNLDEILDFCQKIKVYEPLCNLLSCYNHQEGSAFLDDHQFLYKLESFFLYIKLIIYSDCLEMENVCHFLDKYNSMYSIDVMYHCLCLYFAEDTDVQKYHIEWLKINHTHIPYKDLLFLINVMAKYSEWDFLCALAENVYHNDFLYRISQNLLKSTCMHHISKVDSILDKLLRDCYKQPGLCLNKAYVCKRLGKVEEAKKYYQSEYDQYSSKDALFHLLLIRCDTKQFDEDFYFQQAKNIVDNCMLNLIGYIYQNLNKNEEACMFFLRALLLDEEDMSSLSGYMINGFQIKRDEVSCVEENTVCTLRSESESVQIAIHEPKVIDDIFPNEFASCKHYSYSDMIISNLIYCEVGDEVVYQGKQYKIESICTTHKMILRYAMNVIDKLPGSVPFYATTSEQAIEDLIEFMRESSSSTEEVVSRYNSMKILSPLSVFAYSVGRDMLTSYEYLLYGNTHKIRNNPSVYDNRLNNKKIVLSFDSVIALNHLDMLETLYDFLEVICPYQVKQQLTAAVNNELEAISSDRNAGIMMFQDNHLSLLKHTKETRRERRTFLMKLQKFLNSVEISKAYDFVCIDPQLQASFHNNNMYCESGCIGLAQNLEDCTLISDDQFLYLLADSCKIKNMGICSLLCACDLSWQELLDCSKKLAHMNFANYIPIDLYGEIFCKAIKSQDANALEQISQWLKSDNEGESSEYHRKIIMRLFSNVTQGNSARCSYDRLLGNAAIEHFAQLYPDEFQRRYNSIFGETSIAFEQ